MREQMPESLPPEISESASDREALRCYRLMYQVYTHPKYREYGKEFFAGVDKRYTEYAIFLEGKLGIPYQKLTPLIFILIRACVHYALFEDEFYLKSQIEVLKESLELFIGKYNPKMSGEILSEQENT